MIRSRKKLNPYVLVVAILLILNACTLPTVIWNAGSAQNATPESENTLVYPMETQASQTSVPTQEATSSTPQNTQVEPPTIETIKFLQGGTSAYKSGLISSSYEHSFLVNAAKGQTLLVGVSSSDSSVILEILGEEDGARLLSFNERKSDFQGVLNKTQGYLISLKTSSSDTDYFLSIEVPADIRFKSGQTSATIDGYIEVHKDLSPGLMTRVRYLLYASQGQTMTIEVNSPNNDNLSLGIYGQTDKLPYKRYEIKGLSGSLDLPKTQGYYIDVYSMGESSPFTLKIEIK